MYGHTSIVSRITGGLVATMLVFLGATSAAALSRRDNMGEADGSARMRVMQMARMQMAQMTMSHMQMARMGGAAQPKVLSGAEAAVIPDASLPGNSEDGKVGVGRVGMMLERTPELMAGIGVLTVGMP